MKPATLWFCDVKRDGEVFVEMNHLEDGHCPNDTPTPKHESHNKVWKGRKWSKEFVHLTNDVPAVVIHGPLT